MRRKLPKFSDGGTLTDRWGNPVRSGSGETVKTGSGRDSKRTKREVPVEERSTFAPPKRKPAKERTASSGESYTRSVAFGQDDSSKAARAAKADKPQVEATAVPMLTGRGMEVVSQRDYIAEEREALRKADEEERRKTAAEERKASEEERLKGLMRLPAETRARLHGFVPKGEEESEYKKGGKVKSSASSRGDGIAKRGKTRGRMV